MKMREKIGPRANPWPRADRITQGLDLRLGRPKLLAGSTQRAISYSTYGCPLLAHNNQAL